MISFWEKRSFINYHYLVVGGGIVGLSTAISIKEKSPESSVLVVERGILPSGASTKNAGFACFGSLTEILVDIANMGEDKTMALLEERWLGLQKLQARLGTENIDYQNHGGYELLFEGGTEALHSLQSVNKVLSSLFHSDVFTERKELIRKFGFNAGLTKSLVFNRFESQIDTGKMMKSLTALARQMGVEILTGAQVLSLEEGTDAVEVLIENIQNMRPIPFKAKHVAVCNNAFARDLLPGLDLNPGRGQILVTSPIGALPFKGVFHFDCGYYYFRNFGSRVIFGGGRNLDFRGEASHELEVTQPIIQDLTRKLKEIIVPGKDFDIEQQWSGIMAFGNDRMPILRKVSDRVAVGVRLGGMGVAIGSRLGEQICELILPT